MAQLYSAFIPICSLTAMSVIIWAMAISRKNFKKANKLVVIACAMIFTMALIVLFN